MFLSSADFCFFVVLGELTFFEKKIFSMSNSLDPDQARHLVGPDLGPNCYQRISADDISRPIININI